jgi:hypothetical protein
MPIRCRGRYVQPQITIAEGTDWSFIEGLSIDAPKAAGCDPVRRYQSIPNGRGWSLTTSTRC